MFDVISIGGATQDIYLESEKFKIITDRKQVYHQALIFPLGTKIELEKAIFETGGGGTNTAVTFANLGLKSAFLGRIGQDSSGSEIIKVLKKAKVSTEFVKRDSRLRTAFSVILLTSSGHKTILVNRGAEENFIAKDIKFSKIKTKWLYISSLAGNLKLLTEIINFAKDKEIKVALNPGVKELEESQNLQEILKQIEVLFLNLEEAQKLTQMNDLKEMLKFSGQLAKIVVITLGPKGAIAYDNLNYYQIKTRPKRNLLDSTGAGDAFGSGFISGLILENDIKFALNLGTANARSVLEKIGAKKGLLKKNPQKFQHQAEIINL